MQSSKRLHGLDALRGICLISMIGYHGMWNLVYLFGLPAPWYRDTPGYIWQQSICWTFILLSGFCWNMSRSHVKRGLMVFGGGLLVSAVTHLVMPSGAITFGILTCTGSCVLFTAALEKILKKIPAAAGLIAALILFVLLRNCSRGSLGFEGFIIARLPDELYRNLFTTYLGFPMGNFRSADYFPIFPWFFLFLTGFFLHRILHTCGLDRKLFAKPELPVINYLGRNSLTVYLLHQPVLYGICLVLHALGVI